CPVPELPDEFADQVMERVRPYVHRAQRRPVTWLAAAGILGAISLWIWERHANPPRGSLTTLPEAVASDSGTDPDVNDCLFPELANSNMVDGREPVALAAVKPVSELLRAIGRSLESPVQPIANSTSQAMNNLFKDCAAAEPYIFPIPMMR